jgi:hypothetical protein
MPGFKGKRKRGLTLITDLLKQENEKIDSL